MNGKIAVVTGTSRGIGRAIAAAFAGKGARVIGLARSDQSETAELIRREGGFFEPVKADMADASQASCHAWVRGIAEKHGAIDVLVNNAGVIRRAPAAEFSEKDWNETIRVNLTAPFFLSQAVAAWWIAEGRARAGGKKRLKIIQIASLLSFQGGIRVAAYAAAKHGVAGITKALANEWAAEGINVNAVAPGYIATDNTRPLRDDPERNKAILDRIPQGNWGAPEDIAGGVVWLATEAADYVNGSVIPIDGGWYAR